MKHIKILSTALIAALTFTGCDGQDVESLDSETVSSEQTSMTLYSEPEHINQPLTDSELEQILDTCEEIAYLSEDIHPDDAYDYWPDCVDSAQSINVSLKNSDNLTSDIIFYKITGGDLSSENGFRKKVGSIFTETAAEGFLNNNVMSSCGLVFKDGETYVAETQHMSYSPKKLRLYLSSERVDDNTIILTISYKSYLEEQHSIEVRFIKDSEGIYKVDSAHNSYESYANYYHISPLFSFDVELEIVYGDVIINRPSAWDTTIISDLQKFESCTDFEKAVKIIKDFVYIDDGISSDTSQSITEEWSDHTFYMATDESICNERHFIQKLDMTFTENFKQKYISDAGRRFTFKNGKLYIANHEQSPNLINDERMVLNSFERPDANTILMTFTYTCKSEDFDGNIENLSYKFNIKLVREQLDYFKIDGINGDNPPEFDFSLCLNQVGSFEYGDISITV